jgi:hypothetical protein
MARKKTARKGFVPYVVVVVALPRQDDRGGSSPW